VRFYVPDALSVTFLRYDSGGDNSLRVHVATFDAKQAGTYNRDNCDLAASLFEDQPDIKTRFGLKREITGNSDSLPFVPCGFFSVVELHRV